MIRFDQRRLRRNDGDDFRDFVGELLRATPGFGRPTSRDSGSVDGGIDLYCEQERLVVECKFVGANVADESSRVDHEWKSVSEKLDRALIARDGRADPTRAPYRPWANGDQPVKRYVFATSARLANEQRQRDLVADIKNFFRNTIAPRQGYEHLRNIVVEVIDWTNIETRLVDQPALVFRWLKQWPSGYTELDEETPVGFRAFLHSDGLPYLGRDSWQAPGDLKHAWTETSLVQELTQPEARDPIVVLVGAGGVGKTRLALELARRMRALDWWTVRCDGLLATTIGLRQLLEESSRRSQVLLFADYLEIWPGFEAFANDIVALNLQSGHQIRMIATCRASYRDRLPPSIKLVSVGAGGSVETAYSKAVSRHILSNMGPVDSEILAEKCRHNFALAAFLLFLWQEAAEEFAAEISALREEPSFEAWVVRRLQNAGLRNYETVGALLAACPLPVTAFDNLVLGHGGTADELKRVLVADHWIERREPKESGADAPVWAVFHDVFADVVLARALDAAADRNDTIDRLLERAAANQVLRQTLTAIERLKEIDTIAATDWGARLLELERRKPRSLATHVRVLLANALLTPAVRLALIVANNALREAIELDPACDVGLALAAAGLATADLFGTQQEEFDRVILPLLDNAVARARHSNLVVRLAFKSRPDRYRESARESIIRYPRIFQTHFLLKVWLDDAAAIGDGHAVEMVAQIEDSVKAWLVSGKNARSYAANFVYKSWLAAAATIGGERAVEMVAVVRNDVTTWLAQSDFVTSEGARFVCASWLDAAAAIKGDRALEMVRVIEDSTRAWLADGDHATSGEARFVYASWLNAAAAIGGESAVEMVASIEGDVNAWLATGDHATIYDATYVYESWLMAAKAIKSKRASEMITQIRDRFKAWLSSGDNAIRENVSYQYQSWLTAAAAIGGASAVEILSLIEGPFRAWIAVGDRATSEGAGFVYKDWLEAAEESQLRRFYKEIRAWVVAHQDDDDCDFVLESWLDKHLEFDPVAEPCFRAVYRLYHKPEGTFILKHVVRQHALPEEVVLAALCWCARFPDHDDALSRFGPLLRYDQSVDPAQLIRLAARILYHQSIDGFLHDPFKLAAARATLGSLFQIGNTFPLAEKLARIYFVRWLRDGRVFKWDSCDGENNPPSFDQKPVLIEALLTLMVHEEFSPAGRPEDEAALMRFCDWVGHWQRSGSTVVVEVFEELTARFGLRHLWQRMLPARESV